MDLLLIPLFLDTGLIIVGAIFLVVSFLAKEYLNQKNENCTEKLTAKVIKIEERNYKLNSVDYTNSKTYVKCYIPTYEYTVNGVKYINMGSIGNSNKIIHEGEAIELYYNPNNPNEFYEFDQATNKIVKSLKITSFILFLSAAVICVVGMIGAFAI